MTFSSFVREVADIWYRPIYNVERDPKLDRVVVMFVRCGEQIRQKKRASHGILLHIRSRLRIGDVNRTASYGTKIFCASCLVLTPLASIFFIASVYPRNSGDSAPLAGAMSTTIRRPNRLLGRSALSAADMATLPPLEMVSCLLYDMQENPRTLSDQAVRYR